MWGWARRIFPGLAVTLAIILVSAPGWLPLRDPRFFQSHDGFEHVFRALAIESALHRGELLPRWAPELAFGFGYPIFAVYSPLSYYPAAFLALAGVDMLSAVKWEVAALCVACGVAAYCAARQFGSGWSGITAAACYACAPYTLANAYVRLDLAELATFPLTALAVAGLARIARDDRVDRPTGPAKVLLDAAPFAVPMALLPATHSLSTLIFVPTLLVLAVWLFTGKFHYTRARKRMLFTLCLALATAFGLSTWFLLPALRWQGWLRLSALQSDSHFAPKLIDVVGLAASFGQWKGSGWIGGPSAFWTWSLAPGKLGELPVFVAYGPLVAAVASAVMSIQVKSLRRFVAAFWLAALVSAFFSTTWSSSFWTAFPRLTQLQFPWRLLAPVSLNIALLAGLFIALVPGRIRPVVALAVVASAVVPALVFVRPEYRPIDVQQVAWPAQIRRELQGGFGTTGTGLFLPRWVETDLPGTFAPPVDIHIRTQDANDVSILAASSGSNVLTIRYRLTNATTLTLGALYAPPWQAAIDRRMTALVPMPSTGLWQVQLPTGTHDLSIRLGPTLAETIGDAVSWGTLLVLLFALGSQGWRLASRREGSRDGKRQWALRRSVVLTCGIAGMTLAAGLASFLMHQSRTATPWRTVVADSTASPIQVAAWRPETATEWGAQPSIDVLLLSHGRVTTDDDLMVRLRSVSTGVVTDRRQRPRMGAVSTAGWPSGMVFEDHILLPAPEDLCPDRYLVEFAAPTHNSQETRAYQSLGELATSRELVAGCGHLAEKNPNIGNAVVENYEVDGLDPGQNAPLRPGSELTVTLRLRTLSPTDGDDAITVQLLDHLGRSVSQHDSYGNLDLVFSSLWSQDDYATLRLQLPVPADLSPGVYHLAVGLYSPQRSIFDRLSMTDGSPPASGLRELRRVRVAPPVEPTKAAIATFGGLFALDRSTVYVNRNVNRSAVHVDMGWQSLQTPPADYTLFVQLLDSMGSLVGQQDGPLLGGRMPTSALRPGEVIDESRELILTDAVKPGVYTVIVGWYAGSTGERLTVTPEAASQAVTVGTVTIT